MIEIEHLIEKTIEFLKNYHLKELDIKESPRKKDSCWGKICIACDGIYSFKQAQYIKAIWEKNCKNFRTIITERLNDYKNMIYEDSLINRFFLNSCDIENIKNNIGEKPRKYVKKTIIEEIFNKKLIESGIKCQIKCIYNWFSVKNQNFKWTGKFECIFQKACFTANFDVDLEREKKAKVEIEWIKFEEHEW